MKGTKVPKRYYSHPDYTYPISKDDVHDADKETQKEIMREWFFGHFEDPAENTPYESKEGGYIYIWGGPYDAEEELFSEFRDIIPEETIKELVEELEEQCHEWSGKPSSEEYDKYLLSVIATNTKFHDTFIENIENIKQLLSIKVDRNLHQNYYMLLYVNVITAMETYLSDAFINTVFGSRDLLRRFVENNPDFEKQKFSLNEVFSKTDSIEGEVRNYLIELIWHNLSKIKPMYKRTLNVDFPSELKFFFKAISIRHDIVHRNGKSKNGKKIKVSKQDVYNLIDEVSSFVKHIDEQIANNEI